MKDLGYNEKTCHRCGKQFVVYSAADWVFKRRVKSDKYFCSYSCVKAWDAERDSTAERREKIINALKKGMTVEEISMKYDVDSSSVRWYQKKLDNEVHGG